MADEPKANSTSSDIEENKLVAFLAYFWILCLIPLLLKKDSPFAQFHGKQGLSLAIVETLFSFFVWILFLIPAIGWLLALIGYAVIFVFWLLGIINVLSGKMEKLPLIGEIGEMIVK